MKETMNFRAILLCLPLLLTSAVAANDPAVRTLHGEIMDSQCAYNVHSLGHSHDEMIRKGIPAAVDPESCTNHCVRDKGGVYVLLVNKDVYKLDDQEQAEGFAGKKVKITGTIEGKTLHVVKIEGE